MDEELILAARKEAMESFPASTISGRVWMLCDAHFVRVVQWLKMRVPLVTIVERCQAQPDQELPEEERGLALPSGKAPSRSGLSRFWQPAQRDSVKYGFHQLLNSVARRNSMEGARLSVAEVQKSPGLFLEATIEGILERSYELIRAGDAKLEELATFMSAAVAIRKQNLDRDKFQKRHEEKIDAGITAILERVRGNPEKEELVRQLVKMVNEP